MTSAFLKLKEKYDVGGRISAEMADLRGADLYGANLRGADLHGADLRGANLCGADLHGADLHGADLHGADLCGADLHGADLCGADLCGADLCGADLCGANLRGADLCGADLCGANLRGANLSEANLREAIGLNKYLTTGLYMLLAQPGPIRSYKLVKASMEGPYNGGITYAIGQSYAIQGPDTDEAHECGAGINLAALDWCLKEWREGYRILIAEHTASDIAAIPIGSDGKYRVGQCTIVGEVDLAEIGWPPQKRGGKAC